MMRAGLALALAWPQAGGPAAAAAAAVPVSSELEYSVTLTPDRVTLGQSVTITVTCRAVGTTAQGPSLDDKSLTIELARSDDTSEAQHVFPNRTSLTTDSMTLRGGESATIRLRPGERRTRSFELSRLFPVELLRIGDVRVGISVWNGTRAVKAKPALLRIRSTPAAVPRLLRRLDDDDPAVREQSAALLHRMTGQGLDFDPFGDQDTRTDAALRWTTWWSAVGSKMPWQATKLGRVRYRAVAPRTVDRDQILAALERWRLSGSSADLRGTRWVADTKVTYPPPNSVLTDPRIEQALHQALATMVERADKRDLSPDAVVLILNTVARFSTASFADDIARVEMHSPRGPEWSRTRLVAAALHRWSLPETAP